MVQWENIFNIHFYNLKVGFPVYPVYTGVPVYTVYRKENRSNGDTAYLNPPPLIDISVTKQSCKCRPNTGNFIKIHLYNQKQGFQQYTFI